MRIKWTKLWWSFRTVLEQSEQLWKVNYDFVTSTGPRPFSLWLWEELPIPDLHRSRAAGISISLWQPLLVPLTLGICWVNEWVKKQMNDLLTPALGRDTTRMEDFSLQMRKLRSFWSTCGLQNFTQWIHIQARSKTSSPFTPPLPQISHTFHITYIFLSLSNNDGQWRVAQLLTG